MKNANLATVRDASVTQPPSKAAQKLARLRVESAALADELTRQAEQELTRVAGGPILVRGVPVKATHVYRFDMRNGWWMRMLRVREAAIYLGCKPAFIRKLIEARELRYVGDEGAPWRIDVRELDAWIERSKRIK